jgi:hypothetical protein
VALPVTVMLNRLPRFAAATWDGSSHSRAIISANVIVGAVLMLLMIMLLSAFALEATACGVGVPNCTELRAALNTAHRTTPRDIGGKLSSLR